MSRIKCLYPFAQKWQDSGNITIFSDPHWEDSDRAVMGYDISERDQCKKILENVHSGDTLICLGDVGNPEWINFIKGRRNHLYTVLIKGNHDTGTEKYRDYFDEIYEGPVMIAPKIMLSHEPILNDFWLNIHGHNHTGDVFTMNEIGKGLSTTRATIGINLAGNIINFSSFQLNSYINAGGLKRIKDIHRTAIDNAIEKKQDKFDNI